MVKSLAKSNHVEYVPRVGVKLSDSGERLALLVLRRHRLVELFLVETLGMEWHEIHEEAETLEHAISDRVLERIDAYLGHPQVHITLTHRSTNERLILEGSRANPPSMRIRPGSTKPIVFSSSPIQSATDTVDFFYTSRVFPTATDP